MNSILDNFENHPGTTALLFLVAVIFGGGAMAVRANRIEGERLKDMPDSYWEAKKAEAEASVKKHEIDVASNERLVLDSRNRETAKAEAKREFEKSAPPEYWDAIARKAEAEERTKTAAAQAKAAKEAAYQLGQSIKGI